MESSSDERQVILKSFGFEKRNKKKRKRNDGYKLFFKIGHQNNYHTLIQEMCRNDHESFFKYLILTKFCFTRLLQHFLEVIET